jgi:heme exporter protein CcmD
MDHTPFIIGSYAAAGVILAWCALAPVLRMRSLRKSINEQVRRESARGASHAS